MTVKCTRCHSRHIDSQDRQAWRPRIAIAGLGCETSMFTPARTDAQAFHPKRGQEVIDTHKWLQPGTCLGDAAHWHGALAGHALPGGMVKRCAFEELATEIVSGLQALMPLDGLWYDIHGAMVVEGMDDSEAELLRRIRQVIGPEAIVSASMDLHGNVSPTLAHQVDLITCYRMAPHEDELTTQQRACRDLVDLIQSRQKTQNVYCPLKAWIPLPVLLPGEQTSTRIQPAKRIYAAVPEVRAVIGVLDASIWVGYAWADEPRNHAVVMVTGWEKSAVKRGAERLAKLFWDARKEFHFVAPTGDFKECLSAAVDSPKRPYFISDSGDNPTAGGSGDVTWTLNKLLRWQAKHPKSTKKVIYASIPGPAAVKTAVEAGIGATVTVSAGAEVDDIHGGPVTCTGEVCSIKHGDEWARIEVVLRVQKVFLILTESRKPYHYEHDFTDLNLNIRRDIDIVIVKIGYLEPELFDLAADWKMALTPGGVDQDILRLGHKRIRRPMWPFDKTFAEEPDLTARFIPSSNQAFDHRCVHRA